MDSADETVDSSSATPLYAPRTLLVYGSALLQGLTVVSYPASSTMFRVEYGLSNADYGSLFIPQTLFTIAGSVFAGALAGRLGLRRLLFASLLSSALSAALLASITVVPSNFVLAALLAGTSCMGLGFGIAAAPLNAYPGLLFPTRAASALVALHTVLGLGFAAGPAVVGLLVSVDAWAAFPVALFGLLVSSMVVSLRASLPTMTSNAEESGTRPRLGPAWLAIFAMIVVLYAFAEGTFSNWAAIFLHEARSVSQATAALAISAFWGGLTGGRLLVAALVTRVRAEGLWLLLPVLMAAVFLLLPSVVGPRSGIAMFAAAGMAASAFFPLTVSIASDCYPGKTALVASVLTAALMVGVGVGSFSLGALRSSLSFETLYRVSAAYPAAAVALAILALVAIRHASRSNRGTHAA